MPKLSYWTRLFTYLILFVFVGHFNSVAYPQGNLLQRNLAPMAVGFVLGMYAKSIMPEEDDFE